MEREGEEGVKVVVGGGRRDPLPHGLYSVPGEGIRGHKVRVNGAEMDPRIGVRGPPSPSPPPPPPPLFAVKLVKLSVPRKACAPNDLARFF